MNFEYWHSGDGTWSWHLKSPLGDVVARGTDHRSRDNCLAVIKMVKLAAAAPCREITPYQGHAQRSAASGWLHVRPV